MPAKPPYAWRKLTPDQQQEVLAWRRQHRRPWHAPPHPIHGRYRFHLSASCYEHRPHIGLSPARMDAFAQTLLEACRAHAEAVYAWCVLPNHYHMLVAAKGLAAIVHSLGKMHGRTSRQWNVEEEAAGRKVFHRCSDRAIRSENHFFATMNYIHNNPVHHGYAVRWQEWGWSSAAEFLETMGREETLRLWKAYPLGEFGEKWDRAEW